jgi:hypothetical protein
VSGLKSKECPYQNGELPFHDALGVARQHDDRLHEELAAIRERVGVLEKERDLLERVRHIRLWGPGDGPSEELLAWNESVRTFRESLLKSGADGEGT